MLPWTGRIRRRPRTEDGSGSEDIRSGTCFFRRAAPLLYSFVAPAENGIISAGFSLTKTFWIFSMYSFYLLRFCLSCIWSRPHLSFSKSIIAYMKIFCTVPGKLIHGGVAVFRKSWKDIASYFDGEFPSHTPAKTKFTALIAQLAAAYIERSGNFSLVLLTCVWNRHAAEIVSTTALLLDRHEPRTKKSILQFPDFCVSSLKHRLGYKSNVQSSFVGNKHLLRNITALFRKAFELYFQDSVPKICSVLF